jgi:predicted GIY-YIG superfamily endonuclease
VGYTNDLKNRLKEHLSGKVQSTKSNLNYQLEWYCAFKTEKQAIAFEKYLKSGSGIAFMKKRFFKSESVVLAKDNSSG